MSRWRMVPRRAAPLLFNISHRRTAFGWSNESTTAHAGHSLFLLGSPCRWSTGSWNSSSTPPGKLPRTLGPDRCRNALGFRSTSPDGSSAGPPRGTRALRCWSEPSDTRHPRSSLAESWNKFIFETTVLIVPTGQTLRFHFAMFRAGLALLFTFELANAIDQENSQDVLGKINCWCNL